MSKYRVIKVWKADTATYMYYVQKENLTWNNKHKGWTTLGWQVREEVAKKNAEKYNVKIKEVEDVWDD